MLITGPNRLIHHHKNRLRAKHHISTKATVPPMKLSTSLLNQLNPNLSAEQKMNRTIHQVEHWLETKEHTRGEIKLMKNRLVDNTSNEIEVKCLNNNASPINNNMNNNRIKVHKAEKQLIGSPTMDNKNVLSAPELMDQLKITEDDLNTIVSPKKTFNKESLISSATKKSIKTHNNHPDQAQNNLRTADVKTNNFVMEYASIPVSAEPGECENLLRGDDDEEIPITQNNLDQNVADSSATTATSNATPSTVHRYVHIHHHYHHFDAEEES